MQQIPSHDNPINTYGPIVNGTIQESNSHKNSEDWPSQSKAWRSSSSSREDSPFLGQHQGHTCSRILLMRVDARMRLPDLPSLSFAGKSSVHHFSPFTVLFIDDILFIKSYPFSSPTCHFSFAHMGRFLSRNPQLWSTKALNPSLPCEVSLRPRPWN